MDKMFVTNSRDVCKMCRLCMRNDLILIFLFENSGELTNLAKAITELLQYKVFRDDKYPPYVCCKCSDKIWEFKDFKEKCDSIKGSYEEIFSNETKYARTLNDTFLDKQEPIEFKENPIYIWTEKELECKKSETDTKKIIVIPKEFCMNDEEELPEVTMDYEIFMESIAAEEGGHKMDQLENRSKEQADVEITKPGIEALDCSEAKSTEDQDSDGSLHISETEDQSTEKQLEVTVTESPHDGTDICMQLVEPETVSDSQDVESEISESDMELILSDSECEILEYYSAGNSSGQEVMKKKKTNTQPVVSGSESEMQILDHDSASDIEVLECINLRKKPRSEPRKTKKKNFHKEKLMTNHYVLKRQRNPRIYERKKRDQMPLQSSVECLNQSNLPSATEIETEVNGKGDKEEISYQDSDTGRVQTSLKTTGESDTGNSVLPIENRVDPNESEIQLLEVNQVNKLTNSAPEMGESSKVYLTVEERGRNPSDNKASDPKKSLNPELFTHLSNYSTIELHKCVRCEKQSVDIEKIGSQVIKIKTVTCQYCRQTFENDSELLKHLPSHDGRVKWCCRECGKTDVRWKDVLVHMLAHRKPHKCKEELLMTKPSSSQGHICKVCHKKMPNRSSLRMHLLSHSEHSKWVCPYCQEDFTEQGSLVHHIEEHKALNSCNYHTIK